MAVSIPAQIEQDFHAGKASYQTFQTGFGAQSSIQVDANSSIIIFGYSLHPAGGGFSYIDSVGAIGQLTPDQINIFGTQQVSFWTQDDYYPFLHNINITANPWVRNFDPATGATTTTGLVYEVDTTIIDVSTFIQSKRSVAITHGVLNRVTSSFAGSVPQTSLFPLGLTYGGSGTTVTTETSMGSPFVGNNEFLQPVFEGWQLPPYAYGLIPATASNQASAFCSASALIPAQDALDAISLSLREKPNANYFLVVHYALYNRINN